MNKIILLPEAKQKLEYYCSYQERCHDEVQTKLYQLGMNRAESDEVIVHLLENDYLNEERFACAFARGKFRIKQWGKIRITGELKLRHASTYVIKTALKEIKDEDYWETFEKLAEHHWDTIRETNMMKKRKKFCDFMIRKGWEQPMIYAKVKELENPEKD